MNQRNETFCLERGDGLTAALFKKIRYGSEVVFWRGRVGQQAQCWWWWGFHWRRSKLMGHLKCDLYGVRGPKQQASAPGVHGPRETLADCRLR